MIENAKPIDARPTPAEIPATERFYFLKYFYPHGAVCIGCRMRGMKRQFASASGAFDHLVSYHKLDLRPETARLGLEHLARVVYLEIPAKEGTQP